MKQLKTFQVRDILFSTEEKEQKKYLRGLIPYNSRSEDLGGYTEIIAPTAFNKTLKDGKNVYALLDHSREKILGNTRSQTLKLESTPAGLQVECELPPTTYAHDAYALIERGIISSMSFGFYPVKNTDDPTTRTRVLNEVKLEEVSFLISQDPAYPETNSSAYMRSYIEEQKIDYEKLEEVFSKIKSNNIDNNDKIILKDLVENLRNIYEEKVVEPVVITPVVVETQVEDTTEIDKLNLNLEIEKLLL